MNRLNQRMDQLKREGRKAFIAYIMAGEPSWEAVQGIIAELEQIGVTAVELGVPFSDPIADGPIIQAAANRALDRGVTLSEIFDQVASLRRHTELPLLLMGYWNVFLQYGKKRCLDSARSAGVDGFIIADLPPEADPESRSVIAAALIETGGNVARVARRLGIARGTLRHRIRQYGLGHLIPKD